MEDLFLCHKVCDDLPITFALIFFSLNDLQHTVTFILD